MTDKEKNYRNLLTILSVIILVLAILVVALALNNEYYTPTKRIGNGGGSTTNNNNDATNKTEEVTTTDSNDQVDNADVNKIINSVKEANYTEVDLTNEEKEKINKELYEHFQPGNGNDPIIKYSSEKGDVFSDDCQKLLFVKWYLTFNNKANFETKTIAAKDENGNDCKKMKYSILEDITKEIFNDSSLTCNNNDNFKTDDDGYITLAMGGGGFIPIAIKTVAKYANNDDYYLIIHIYQATNIDTENLTYKELTNYLDDPNANIYSHYIKLKYGIKDNKKYLKSFEYLN